MAEKDSVTQDDLLEQLILESPVPTFVINQDHQVTHWNKACERLTGLLGSEAEGTSLQWRAFYADPKPVLADMILDGETADQIEQHYRERSMSVRRSKVRDNALEVEGFFPHLGKRGKWIFFTASPIIDREKKIVAVVETLQDITDREERLAQIVNGSLIAMFAIDRNHLITHWNKACEELTGLSEEEVMRTNSQWIPFYKEATPVLADLIVDGASVEQIEKIYLQRGMVFRELRVREGAFELEGHFPDLPSGEKWLLFTAVALKDEEGEIVGALETLQDISGIKQAEAERERLRTVEVVNSVVQVMTERLDPQALMDAIVFQIATHLGCNHCSLFMPEQQIDGDKRITLVPRASFDNLRPDRKVTRRFEVGKGIVGSVFESGQPERLRDARQDGRFEESKGASSGPLSMLVVPVQAGGKTVGVISTDQDAYDYFTPSHQRLVETLALQIGVTVERAESLEVLLDISARITSTQDVTSVLEHVVEGAIELTNTTSGIIHLVGEDGVSILESVAWPRRSKHPESRLARTQGLTLEIATTKREIVIPVVSEDERVNPTLKKRVKSLIGVPLLLDDTVVGVLFLNDKRLHQFTDRDIFLLKTMANQAAIAIRNARLVEQLRRTNAELKVLTDIGRTVSNLGIDQILDFVYDGTAQIMDLSNAQVQIAFYDEEKQEVTFPLAVEREKGVLIDKVSKGIRELPFRNDNEPPEVAAFQKRSSGSRFGLTEYVIFTKEAVLIPEDFENRAHALRHDGKQVKVLSKFGRHDRPTYSWLGVPMIVQNRVIGIISVGSLKTEHAFDERQKELLATMASQAAVAIENARLYEDLDNRVKARTQQLTGLQEIGVNLTAQLELDDVLASIAENANVMMKSDFATLFTYDPNQKGFISGIRRGCAKDRPSAPSSKGLSGRIAANQESAFAPDALAYPGVKAKFIDDHNISSFAGVPLVIRKRTVGVLYVNYLEPHEFTEEEQEILGLLANQAAVAIENATLYGELEKRVEERTREWKDATRRLTAAERLAMMSDVAAEFAHRMNNLAGTIPLRINLIQEQLAKGHKANAKTLQQLEGIKKDALQLMDASEEIKRSTEIREEENVSVNTLLDIAVERVWHSQPEASRVVAQKRYATDLPALLADRNKLLDTFTNIVRNGVQAMPNGGTLTISSYVTGQGETPYVEVAIADTGNGIPKSDLPQVFELFFTTKPGGLGFGLWRDRNLVKGLGGSIDVSSEESLGTTMTIRLPVQSDQRVGIEGAFGS